MKDSLWSVICPAFNRPSGLLSSKTVFCSIMSISSCIRMQLAQGEAGEIFLAWQFGKLRPYLERVPKLESLLLDLEEHY